MEPTILTDLVSPDAADVDVSGLETVTFSRDELRAHDKRTANAVWKEARQAFAAKATRAATAQQLTERIDRLERVVLELGNRLLPPTPKDV